MIFRFVELCSHHPNSAFPSPPACVKSVPTHTPHLKQMFMSLHVGPFGTFHTNEIIQYVVFCVWLLSLCVFEVHLCGSIVEGSKDLGVIKNNIHDPGGSDPQALWMVLRIAGEGKPLSGQGHPEACGSGTTIQKGRRARELRAGSWLRKGAFVSQWRHSAVLSGSERQAGAAWGLSYC